MRNRTFLILCLAVLILLGAALASSCGKSESQNAHLAGEPAGGTSTGDDADDTSDDTSADDDTVSTQPNIAIIYKYDASRASAYGDLLAQYGFQWFSVDEQTLPGTDLSHADVILVDAQTQWYLEAAAQAVDATGLPILGLGPGGMHLYDWLNLQTGFFYANGPWFDSTMIFIIEQSAKIFLSPKDFGLNQGDVLQIMGNPLQVWGIPIDPPASGVVPFSSVEGSDILGSILIEQSRYMIWGFDMSAGDLNQNGADLLANCLFYLAGK